MAGQQHSLGLGVRRANDSINEGSDVGERAEAFYSELAAESAECRVCSEEDS
jgi:hypothetical protein